MARREKGTADKAGRIAPIKLFAALLAAFFLVCSLAGCFTAFGEETPEPSLNKTPESTLKPSAPILTPIPSPKPTPSPTPSPSPSPEPTPRPKTFEELAPTTTMSFEELVGDNGIYEEPESWPTPGAYKVVVDIYHQVVMVYSKDERGEYTVPERYMVCTTGARKTPTPTGTFEAGDHRVRFGLFVNDNVYGQYWTQVVRRIYFHSLLYSKRNASTYTTSSYRNLGKRASHGCIRLLVPDARWIYYHIGPGSPIEIRRGSKDDLATAAIKEKLTRAPLPKKRPKLVKGEIPNTDNWAIEDVPVASSSPGAKDMEAASKPNGQTMPSS